MPRPTLNTTAVAVLGLIGVRPMTGYEITRTAQRTFRYLWQREDSVLYQQPRRLEERGLVTAAVEDGLRRPRTRYTITEEGRAAVAEWLASPPHVPFDWEPAVRLVLADHGSREDLLATLSAIRDWARTGMEEGLEVAESYLDGSATFPERDALNGLNTVFVSSLLLTVHEWATVAQEQVEQWRSPIDDGGHDDWRHLLSANLAKVRKVLRSPAGAGTVRA